METATERREAELPRWPCPEYSLNQLVEQNAEILEELRLLRRLFGRVFDNFTRADVAPSALHSRGTNGAASTLCQSER